MEEKENITSLIKKYVYPLGEDCDSFTEPALDSNEKTGILFFMNVLLNIVPDRLVKKATQAGWKQSARFFKQAAASSSYQKIPGENR